MSKSKTRKTAKTAKTAKTETVAAFPFPVSPVTEEPADMPATVEVEPASAPTVEVETEPPQALEVPASACETAFNRVIAALNARMVYQRDSEQNARQAEHWLTEIKALKPAHIALMLDMGIDCGQLAARLDQTKKTDESFVAIYAMQKIRKLIDAMLHKNARILDGYTSTILQNAFGLDKLRNKTALVSLSRGIEFTELDQTQSIRKRYNCEPTTASTQASSSRKALQALQCAAYERSDKALVMNDCETTQALKSLFA